MALSYGNMMGDTFMHLMPPENDAIGLIGKTPMVELRGFDTGPCRVFLKLESENPGGSIKDRMALSMIEAAEASGALRAGGTIVEATAGNKGLGPPLVAGLQAVPPIPVDPRQISLA